MARGPNLAVALLLLAVFSGCAPQTRPSVPAPNVSVVRLSGPGSTLPIIQRLSEAFRQSAPGIRFEILESADSTGAVQGLVDEILHLAVVNRPLAEPTTADLMYVPFARDMVVFGVNHHAPVLGLTSEQIRDIYSGQVTDWRELGAESRPVVPLDRDTIDSARRELLLPIMGRQPVTARRIVLSRTADMLDALSGTPGAIGYATLSALNARHDTNTRVLAVNGIWPSSETLLDGRYPWSLTFAFVYHRTAPPETHRFVEFVRGPAGRRVMEEHGVAAINR